MYKMLGLLIPLSVNAKYNEDLFTVLNKKQINLDIITGPHQCPITYKHKDIPLSDILDEHGKFKYDFLYYHSNSAQYYDMSSRQYDYEKMYNTCRDALMLSGNDDCTVNKLISSAILCEPLSMKYATHHNFSVYQMQWITYCKQAYSTPTCHIHF